MCQVIFCFEVGLLLWNQITAHFTWLLNRNTEVCEGAAAALKEGRKEAEPALHAAIAAVL